MHMRWKIVVDGWRILGSALILLVMSNIALHGFFLVRYGLAQDPERWVHRLSDLQRAAYAGMTPQDINDLLEWTWTPGYVYEHETGFREAPRSSKFVNVSSDGIRATGGAENDLAKADLSRTLLLFGGSTAFGYGVSDGQTIAAHLQQDLPRYNIINMGRAFYYSAQENLLLLKILQSGHKVANAAFLDGINERCDIIAYQPALEEMFKQVQARRAGYFWDWRQQVAYPMQWFYQRLRKRIAGPTAAGPSLLERLHANECHGYGKTVALREVAKQNLAARDGICKAFGVTCLTFVQPFPGLHGVHLDERTLPEAHRRILRAKYEELEPVWKDRGSIEISDALDGLHKHAFVDGMHYSDEANKLVAQRMLPALGDRLGWH